MKLHELNKAPEKKSRKRVGRGPGSGLGKTSGRGEKGYGARAGSSMSAWFEGGQTPLYARIPKRGFNNKRFEIKYATVNLSDLNIFNDGDIITPEKLIETGLVKKLFSGIKILGNGSLEKKLTIKAHRFSSKAVTKIEESGGKSEVI